MGTLLKILRPLGKTLFLIALALLFIQCSSDSGGGDPTDEVVDQGTDDNSNGDGSNDDLSDGTDLDGTDVTLLVNPADPIWFTVDYDDGTTVNYHGTKDETGLPEMLTHLEIIEDENNGAVFYLDEQYRIAEMIYSDGTLFRFDWTSTKANLTVVANDGSTQVNTEIDLNDSGKPGELTNGKKITTREGRVFIDRSAHFLETFNQGLAARQEVVLNVGQCGELSDAPLPPYFEIIDGDGNLLRTLFTKRVGQGQYAVDVPIPEPADPNVQLLCASLSSQISDFCTALDFSAELTAGKVCPKVISALDNLPFGVSDEVRQGILLACEKMVVDYLPKACQQLNEGGTTINEKLCAAETSDFELPIISYMYGVVPVAPIDKVTESLLLEPEKGSIPDFFLDLGDETIISDLTLNPAAPQAGQSYQAVLTVGCTMPGMVITIQVTGSDGFSDTVNYNETQALPTADYTISVPGAELGVQDTITVTATFPDGSSLTRTASLSFG